MPSQSNGANWFDRAEIDYFSSFLKLWLSFNATYKIIFQNDHLGTADRAYIEKLKGDNVVKDSFKKIFNADSDERREFDLNLSELVKTYGSSVIGGKSIIKDDILKPQMNGSPVDKIDFSGFVHHNSFRLKNCPPRHRKIGNIYIKEDPDGIWPYFIEILYMLRNQLMHGSMEPTDQEHDTIRNCYILLRLLIKDLV